MSLARSSLQSLCSAREPRSHAAGALQRWASWGLVFRRVLYIASVTRIYSVRSGARQVYSGQNARMAAVTENRSYTFTVLDSRNYTVLPQVPR
jgi:hypothetical protein